jgi:hypothetical protein
MKLFVFYSHVIITKNKNTAYNTGWSESETKPDDRNHLINSNFKNAIYVNFNLNGDDIMHLEEEKLAYGMRLMSNFKVRIIHILHNNMKLIEKTTCTGFGLSCSKHTMLMHR